MVTSTIIYYQLYSNCTEEPCRIISLHVADKSFRILWSTGIEKYPYSYIYNSNQSHFLFCENVPITVLSEFENIVFTHQKNLLSGSESSNLLWEQSVKSKGCLSPAQTEK